MMKIFCLNPINEKTTCKVFQISRSGSPSHFQRTAAGVHHREGLLANVKLWKMIQLQLQLVPAGESGNRRDRPRLVDGSHGCWTWGNLDVRWSRGSWSSLSSGSSWKFHHQDHHDNATKESYWTMLVGWTMRRWWRTFCGRQTNQAAALSRFSFCEISSDICKILWISRTAWCWKTAGNSWDTPSIAHQGPDNQKSQKSWNVLDAILTLFYSALTSGRSIPSARRCKSAVGIELAIRHLGNCVVPWC